MNINNYYICNYLCF